MKLVPEQLEPLAGDLRDDRRVVQEPPAPERHQVGELARRDAQLVLVLARQHRHQETVVGVLRQSRWTARHVGPADAVACVVQRRIHAAAHADHHRERQAVLAAGRQHDFAG